MIKENYDRSDGVLNLVKQMVRHKDAVIRSWGRRIETAYWREKQLPLIPDTPDDDEKPVDDEE